MGGEASGYFYGLQARLCLFPHFYIDPWRSGNALGLGPRDTGSIPVGSLHSASSYRSGALDTRRVV